MARSPAPRDGALPADYPAFLEGIKTAVSTARAQAALAVSAVVLAAYWEIGAGILVRENKEGWGARVVERLASDLRREFPDMKGLSVRNLRYMREFARAWPAESASEMLQQSAATLPWGHHMVLLDKLGSPEELLWYAAAAAENGWSRKVLTAQIASDLHGRQGSAMTSFDRALPAADSELVRDALKDPYNFEFLNLSADAKERRARRASSSSTCSSTTTSCGASWSLISRSRTSSLSSRAR